MAKRPNTLMILFSIFLLLNSLILVLSIDINYNRIGNNEWDVDKADNLENLCTLSFTDPNDIPKYVKVTLTPKGEQETPTLCYSSTDQNCKLNRVVLASRVDKKPVIACVREDQIRSNSRKIYVTSTCKEAGCGFNLLFEAQERCQVDSGNGTVYSFAVENNNKNMDFEAFGVSYDYDISFMNIGIEGSESATITVANVDSSKVKLIQYEGAKMASFPIENLPDASFSSLAIFSINGMQPGEFVRISVYLAKNGVGPDNLLYPGGPSVLGVVYENMGTYPEICYPVSAFTAEYSGYTQFYVTGKIYSKYALFWVADQKRAYQQETEKTVLDGLLACAVEPKNELKYICFEFPLEKYVEDNDVLFSVRMVPIATKNTPDFYFSNPPFALGQTYRNIIPKGKSVFYHGAKIDKDKERYSFNLFNRKGVAQMYMANCRSYPDCTYNMTRDIEDPLKLEFIRNTGKISMYDRKIEETMGVFDEVKQIMVVKCVDDGSDEKGYCEFDASINVKGQTINLIEGENFEKYVIKDEIGKFEIDFKKAMHLKNVGVEIMIHTGEIIFEGEASTSHSERPIITKYLLSNKVFINFDLKRQLCDVLYVNFRAIKNSFFTIKYVFDHSEIMTPYSEEVIFPGESYMVTMEPGSAPRKLHFINDRYKTEKLYLTNFFSVNCDFKVVTNKTQKGEVEVPFADGYAQDILSVDDGEFYKRSNYDYEVSIEKFESSEYYNKMCMLYVIGYQTLDISFLTRIMIGTNVNQQIIFNDNYDSVAFLYPVPDTTQDLVVYANIIDKAFYYINIAINSADKAVYKDVITKSTPFFLDKDKILKNCTANTFCDIIIEMQYVSAIESLPKTNHMIEVTVRPADKEDADYKSLRVPTYIQKGIAKKDFTTGDGYYYLYTDIGRNDQGDITINFFRDYGDVYGRIVKKGTKDSEGELEWMEMYRLPALGWGDEENYNKYLKKFHINVEDTEDCIVGCYLILGIRISQIGEDVDISKFYPFSIITEITQGSYGQITDVPITTIQLDEFIIGNVDVSKNVKITKFYQIWIPRDTYELYFDWQSELAGLYISVDDSLQTIFNADFTLKPNGIDSILVLEKHEILNALEKKKIPSPYINSLEDVKLTIGIWTDKTDSADTELYSLRIHEVNPEESDLDIYEVNTDQKILCKPRYLGDGSYSCLFMVTYDKQDVDLKSDLLVYATSTNKGDSSVMYAKFIDANIYEEFYADFLRGSIPSETSADYKSIPLDTNYFYIKLADYRKGYYLYVNVITYCPDDVMMVASMNCFDKSDEGVQIFYPNARTEQIIQMKDDSLIIEFSSDSSLIVNIENLGGEADLRWEEDAEIVHYLRGKGDRLTLTTSTNYKRLLFKKLKSDREMLGQDPGFVFLLDFYTRDPTVNFDEVAYGGSIEIGYRNTDLPIYLYSKKVDYSNDIQMAVTFRDSHIELEGEYKSSPIEVRAFLDKRDTIYSSRSTSDFEPSENKIDGLYDPAIKTAQVFLSDFDMNMKFNIKPEDYPTLLLYLGKSVAYESKTYPTFGVETQFTRTNSLVIPVEKVYNYGKFYGVLPQYYKLRNDKNKTFIKIELSFNSDELAWTIGDKGSDKNTSKYEIKSKVGKGKILLTIEPNNDEIDFVFLNIFKIDYMDEANSQIQNYAFKYINVEKEEDFFDYEIVNNNATIEYKDERKNGQVTITVKFNKIDIGKDKANITYFLKIVDSVSYIPNENFNTVSVTESPYYTKYKRNPDADSNNKITLEATGDFQYWGCLQVIAQIQENKVLEYVAYNSICTDKNIPSNKDEENTNGTNGGSEKSDSTALLIVICVTLVLLIIALAAVVFYFHRKNQSLKNQVKHVSFQQNNSVSSDPDLLLNNQINPI